jgi:hypothetical protein
MKHSRLLSDLDSNQDPQSQNLRYYHYTIGQERTCKIKSLKLNTL